MNNNGILLMDINRCSDYEKKFCVVNCWYKINDFLLCIKWLNTNLI